MHTFMLIVNCTHLNTHMPTHQMNAEWTRRCWESCCINQLAGLKSSQHESSPLCFPIHTSLFSLLFPSFGFFSLRRPVSVCWDTAECCQGKTEKEKVQSWERGEWNNWRKKRRLGEMKLGEFEWGQTEGWPALERRWRVMAGVGTDRLQLLNCDGRGRETQQKRERRECQC